MPPPWYFMSPPPATGITLEQAQEVRRFWEGVENEKKAAADKAKTERKPLHFDFLRVFIALFFITPVVAFTVSLCYLLLLVHIAEKLHLIK